MEHGSNTSVAWESLEYDYSGNVTVEEYEYYHAWPVTLSMVVRGLAIAAGLLANTFLLVLFAMSPRQRTVSSTFLLQRAVADVLSLTSLVFFLAIGQSGDKHHPALCTGPSVTIHVATVASPVLFLLFTLDSYLASRPQHHTLPHRRRVMQLTSAAAWLLSGAVGIAAYFLTHTDDGGRCNVGPFYQSFAEYPTKLLELCVLLLVPLVVMWVFVSMSLPPPSPVTPKAEGLEGLNRRLLLGLAATFTVLHGLYWLVTFISFVLPYHARPFYIIEVISYSLPIYNEAINPILVICLTKGLRQRVAGWLPRRHSGSLPLQDL